MNAPTRLDYEPAILALRPNTPAEELELRSSLLYMRDRAMATKASPQTCEQAWKLLDIVERECADWAMNHRIDVEGLRKLRRACITAVCAATEFDMLFQPTLGLEERA